MCCCVHDHKPWHASGICREMTFRDITFHLPIGEMTIILDDVSCVLYLPIREKLLGHRRLGGEEVVEMMVTHLGADLTKAASDRKLHTAYGNLLLLIFS